MRNIITLDGTMASGKNTNVRKLCDHFGIPSTTHSNYNKIIELGKSIQLFQPNIELQMLPWIGSLMYCREYNWKNKDLIVVRDFWNPIIHAMTEGFNENLLRAFETLATRAGEMIPTCSFYIYIPTYESRIRMMKREAVLNDMVETIHGVDIDGLSVPERFIEDDKRRQEAIHSFAERHPFFYIIDGDTFGGRNF